jgi:hypothetical protein
MNMSLKLFSHKITAVNIGLLPVENGAFTTHPP